MITDTAPYRDGHPTFTAREKSVIKPQRWMLKILIYLLLLFVNIHLVLPLY